MFDWFHSGKNVSGGQTLLVHAGPEGIPEPLRAMLEARLGPIHLLPGKLEAVTARGQIRKLQPKCIVVIGDPGLSADFWREVGRPLYWINAPGSVAESALRCCVRSSLAAAALPGSLLTGDPLLDLEPDIEAGFDPEFCERFQEVRDRQRWILYFPQSIDPEEDLAYQTFLRLSRRGVGLLVLAPADPARYETVYRDAMRFHLLTNRHGRLMTSYVPHKTRVYYIENPIALRNMYACADVVVAGGSFGAASGYAPQLVVPLALGRPVVVGPRGDSALKRAAIADGAVLAVGSDGDLENSLARLLQDAPARALLGGFGRDWLQQQRGALARVLATVSQW